VGHWLRRDASRVALLDVCRPDLHRYRHAKDRHAPDPDHRLFPHMAGDRSLDGRDHLDFHGVAMDVLDVVAAQKLREDILLEAVGSLAIDGVGVVVGLGQDAGVVHPARVMRVWGVNVGPQEVRSELGC